MASSVLFTCLPTLPSLHYGSQLALPGMNTRYISYLRLKKYILSVSKKDSPQIDAQDSGALEISDEVPKKARRATKRNKKKVVSDSEEENSVEMTGNVNEGEKDNLELLSDSPKKTRRRPKKASSLSSDEEETTMNTVKRRSKKVSDVKDVNTRTELRDLLDSTPAVTSSSQMQIQITEDDMGISSRYDWPPLVCCFGAAQNAFIPYGRLANRLIDHHIHDSMKDMFWSPDRFFRAPGGPSSSVALALAAIGGRVAFMGKLGDDDYGQCMLDFLNSNNVQTQSMKLDSSKPTALSRMKIGKRGSLKMSLVKPCAEDNFLTTEVNIDVLKEAKMFYFNSSSLLDQNMRWTALQAVKASKKLGGLIFFDPNLPLPLWKSSEETKAFISEAWNLANIIELTKQELEFLCGIEPLENFDTKDNGKIKFIHHKPEVVMQLWHENLKVLFVTNGTSKIHYYTEKDNGWVHGMEDPPITPLTGDMSVSGDAIVAALMRMITVEPHLVTDKNYLEHMIKYAINCGVTDQWLLARVLGYPQKNRVHPSHNELDRPNFLTEKEYRTAEELVE